MKPVLALLSAFLALPGCFPGNALVPVTAANSAEIAQCQSVSGLHNGIVIGDYTVGGLGAATGAVAAALPAQDVTAKDALAIAGATGAALVAVGAGLASLTASEYVNDGCGSLVAPLVNGRKP